MSRTALLIVPALLTPLLAGCPVTQSQNTPADQFRLRAPGGQDYWLYVPSHYSRDRAWPLAITLHGMHGFDGSSAQVREWKALAEKHGFLVAAPALKSPSGVYILSDALRRRALEDDERIILAVLADVRRQYRIDERCVLLTGFSSGGYPLYHVGLRNPDKFTALAARGCNSSDAIFEDLALDDRVRGTPVLIIHGKDEFAPIREQSWAAFRWLRQHGFSASRQQQVPGGHIRQPGAACRWWLSQWPSGT